MSVSMENCCFVFVFVVGGFNSSAVVCLRFFHSVLVFPSFSSSNNGRGFAAYSFFGAQFLLSLKRGVRETRRSWRNIVAGLLLPRCMMMNER